MNLLRRIRGLVAAACLVAPAAASAQTLYWMETNFPAPQGRDSDTNGGGAAAFALDPETLPEGIAFDDNQDKIYWVESSFSGARILRANQNYTGIEVLVSGGSAFRGIALDLAGGKMYWTSSNLVEGSKIRRANLDGSNVQVIVDLGANGSNPRGIALDVAAGKMYWADLGLAKIQRANLDGSLPEDVVNISSPWGVALDPAGGYLYWANYQQGNIARSPLAGGPVTKLRVGLANPTYLTIDPVGGMMYWIEAGASGQKLRRSNLLVGGIVEDLPVAVTTYGGIVFSPQSIVSAPAPGPVTRFELGPIIPNPASEFARVEFALPHPARVRLRVLDVRGREVARLLDGERPAGRQQAIWTGRAASGSLDPGIYFLLLEAPGVKLVQRAVFIH
jgi:hypothetical protein